MEATCNDFTRKDLFNSNQMNHATAIANCQMIITPQSVQNISNTDIVIWINDLHKTLDNNQEVGLKISHLGKSITFYIDHIAHQNQSMIYFKGQMENGKLVHFVKHSSDLSIELQPLKRRSNDVAKTPFGFDDWKDYDVAKNKHLD